MLDCTCVARRDGKRLLVLLPVLVVTLPLVWTLSQRGPRFGPRQAPRAARFPAAFASPPQGPLEAKLSKGKFLVAGRELRDPNFAETVVLLTEYGRDGAMGLIINRGVDVKLSEVLPKMRGLGRRSDTIYIGGPVALRGMLMLVRAANEPKGSQRVFDKVYLSGSRELLEATITTADSNDFRVYAGHAGWAPGQLEGEVQLGGWHIFPAASDTVFDPHPSKVWQRLIDRTTMRFAGSGMPDAVTAWSGALR